MNQEKNALLDFIEENMDPNKENELQESIKASKVSRSGSNSQEKDN